MLRVKPSELAAWANLAEGQGLDTAGPKRKKAKVKRSPAQRYTDLERALTLATTPLARVVIGRAIERMTIELKTAPLCAASSRR